MTTMLHRMDDAQQDSTDGGLGTLHSKLGYLPIRALNYHARIVALATHTTIVQTYINPYDEPIEVDYIFPLQANHAVVGCEMRMGNRVVRAQLKERGEARDEYLRAIRRGHLGALMEENRPETFSMRVGNILPGEDIQVCIETVTQLPIEHGEWTLRLPLVVAPRYTAGIALPRQSCGRGTESDTDQVPDASCITPPTLLSGLPNPVDLRLTVDVDMGSLPCHENWIEQLKSSLHSVLLDVGGDNGHMSRSCRVELMPGERVNRDFILRGQVLVQNVSSSLVCERACLHSKDPNSNKAVFALTIVPPTQAANGKRDIVFILDASGSMEGWKIHAARRAVSRLIDWLSPGDRFQLLAFASDLSPYNPQGMKGAKPGWINNTDRERFEAVSWISRVDASGGTEIGPALDFALQACCRDLHEGPDRARAIVLVTDGQITGEDSLLRLFGQVPKSQLPQFFCLGVDRAVNASVMQRLSAATSGLFELAESETRLDEVLGRFAKEICSPSLKQVSITSVSGESLELYPTHFSRLYAGRPTTIYGRCSDPDRLVVNVKGNSPDGPSYDETVTATVKDVTDKPLLLPLWTRQCVRTLEDELVAGGCADEALKKRIVECSLAGQVLSRLTAFVAVDESQRTFDGLVPHTFVVPVELPEDWEPDHGDEAVYSRAAYRADYDEQLAIGAIPPQLPAPNWRKDRIALARRGGSQSQVDVEDWRVVLWVQSLLGNAISQQATHILVEGTSTSNRFQYVIDGKLQDPVQPDEELYASIVARLKWLSRLTDSSASGMRTGTVEFTIDGTRTEFILHALGDCLLIELPAAKQLAVTPGAVQQWWQRNGQQSMTK